MASRCSGAAPTSGPARWCGADPPLGRTLSLALAVVNLLVLPFGTALGIYALWILLTSDGRRLFEPQPRVHRVAAIESADARYS